MNTNHLIDQRNQSLWNRIQESYDCRIQFNNSDLNYSCYTEGKKAIIFVPESNKNPDSFTHELLHIFLMQKGVFISGGLKQSVYSSKLLKNIFNEDLLDHMGNCFDHIKMLSYYLDLGFNRKLFILDYEEDKCTDEEIQSIHKNFMNGIWYNSRAIRVFIGKVFAIHACPNDKIDYYPKLKRLESIDQSLYEINMEALGDWNKVDIENNDILAFNYQDVLAKYIHKMEDWVSSRKII